LEENMKKIKKYPGIIVPVITIFNSDGSINCYKTKKFISHLVEKGVHGIFVAGGTGEYSLMTLEQRKEIISIGIEATKKTIPVFAGTGHHNTRIVIELSQFAEEQGADGVIISLPHYPHVNEEGLYLHYKAIAEKVHIPKFIYNCPRQYVIDISPITVAKLARNNYIQGIKDSHLNIDHTAEIIRLTNKKITIWTGYETKLLPALCLGADGAVCTVSNLIPDVMVDIYNLYKEGKISDAAKKQLSIFELCNLLSPYNRHDMQPLKEGIRLLGFEVGDALPPAQKVPKNIIDKIRLNLERINRKI